VVHKISFVILCLPTNKRLPLLVFNKMELSRTVDVALLNLIVNITYIFYNRMRFVISHFYVFVGIFIVT
jgi:hypothetical protein